VNLKQILEEMMQRRASDLHMKVGTPPTIRIDGRLAPLEHPAPTQKELEAIAEQVLTPKQRQIYEDHREVDFAFGVPGLARFRANFYQQRGTMAMAIRQVPLGVPSIEELNLPGIVEELSHRPRGLVLVTGTVGSGKSTTLASMLDVINRGDARSVITVEDPVEFLHRDDKAIISQREVGLDTESFHDGLKHILRQDPDVILLGEIRDKETMSIGLMAADTGHLVFSTLHTVDAAQTVNRVLSFYSPHEHGEIRFLLASTLQAVISLRLIPHASGTGRVPACEVMICTATIREYILDTEKTFLIRTAMREGTGQYGMQTFDQSLMSLYKGGLITLEDALRNSTNPSELELRIRGVHATSDKTWEQFEQGATLGGEDR
jgi:twitching motility protein PilT